MVFMEVEKKGRILTKAQFGCLRDAYSINVTRGCEFGCVYCYARGYPGAPVAGVVHVYCNLPEKLSGELDSPRRRSVMRRVVFNTASDSFQTHPLVLDVTYRAMKVLLQRGIGFSFLTKGWIPDRFISLFSDHADLITPRIGMVSLSPHYRDVFEPRAATAAERLQNIDRLKGVGLDVEVRVDPVIPFFTDDEASIKRLYAALAAREIKTVSLSYLHMRPAILAQLRKELPPTEMGVLRSCFQTQPWTQTGSVSRSKLIPRLLRDRGYRRFRDLGKPYDIHTLICACKNPDMPAHRCSRGTGMKTSPVLRDQRQSQLSLFSC